MEMSDGIQLFLKDLYLKRFFKLKTSPKNSFLKGALRGNWQVYGFKTRCKNNGGMFTHLYFLSLQRTPFLWYIDFTSGAFEEENYYAYLLPPLFIAQLCYIGVRFFSPLQFQNIPTETLFITYYLKDENVIIIIQKRYYMCSMSNEVFQISPNHPLRNYAKKMINSYIKVIDFFRLLSIVKYHLDLENVIKVARMMCIKGILRMSK